MSVCVCVGGGEGNGAGEGVPPSINLRLASVILCAGPVIVGLSRFPISLALPTAAVASFRRCRWEPMVAAAFDDP